MIAGQAICVWKHMVYLGEIYKKTYYSEKDLTYLSVIVKHISVSVTWGCMQKQGTFKSEFSRLFWRFSPLVGTLRERNFLIKKYCSDSQILAEEKKSRMTQPTKSDMVNSQMAVWIVSDGWLFFFYFDLTGALNVSRKKIGKIICLMFGCVRSIFLWKWVAL